MRLQLSFVTEGKGPDEQFKSSSAQHGVGKFGIDFCIVNRAV